MEIFSDTMILTDYSQKLKKTHQILAVILVNSEEPFYSEKARKIAKMWKNVANYFLEQQGWTHFLKKLFLRQNINTVWSVNDLQLDNAIKTCCNRFLSKQKWRKVQWVLRYTSLTDRTVHHFRKLSKNWELKDIR